MLPNSHGRPPRWYTIPVRVVLVTFICTLISFAVSLFLGIVGTVIVAAVRGVHADMTLAYRHIALPFAVMAGSIIFVLALVMEIRHYRQSKALAAIERVSSVSANPQPRIAIPMPHSGNRKYAEKAIPQYERAVKLAGGEPVRIPLDRAPAEVMKVVEQCDGVLLPGSNADVDPAKFGATRSPQTAAADARRDALDDLLLQDAYSLRKPVLGICYGLQSLNVYRAGSLIQHIPDFLPEEMRTRVNHGAGGKVAVAHQVEVAQNSKLAGVLMPEARKLVIPVNSSHHQSADKVGDGLRIAARCCEDGIIEALEGTAPDHFVLAVQWHPERSVEEDKHSRAIFQALVKAAEARRRELKRELMV
ncbi:MAG: gamma-glutamyl-gamma-aminobutyrate hydrolase family protein [Candidatus Sulfotelmatobacter sp.]